MEHHHKPAPQPRVSVRLLWALARTPPRFEDSLRALEAAGFTPREFANPDTRVPRQVLTRAFEEAAATADDPAFGLRAGERMEASQLDVLEQAARHCSNLGEAIHFIARHFRLVSEGAELTLTEEGDRAVWGFRWCDGAARPPAMNDFVVASALTFTRRVAGLGEACREVHVMHHEPTDAAEYARVLRAPVRFDMPQNALVFARSRLSIPMRNPNAGLLRAFEARAAELSRSVARRQVSAHVRELLQTRLDVENLTMSVVAKRLGMSVPTLRRRLAEEGVVYRTLLDGVRCELTRRHLNEGQTMREIAPRLGYSSVKALERAHKRWARTAHVDATGGG